MAKKRKVAPNGSWRLSRETFDSMPDLPFLMGVSIANPPRLSFTLTSDRVARSSYLYDKVPGKQYVNPGGWIVYIGGWVYLSE